jgi:nucleoside-diphosphate-sugar epimerase
MSAFPGRKILITGATGFIGSHLGERLCANGAEVHAVFRDEFSQGIDRARWWRADLADFDAVERLLNEVKPEVIFHLASHVSGNREPSLVIPTFRSNLASTVNLLVGARKIGCSRFILTGSLEEPNFSDAQDIACSPYAMAKWAGSAYARMFHELYQLPVVIVRLFMVYGPAQRDLSKLIPYVILSLLKGEAPKLASGSRDVDWIYIEDVVDALIAAAQAENVEGCTTDVGSGVLVPIRAVVERLVALINPKIEPLFGTLPDRAREPIRTADIAASRVVLGWQPRTSLAEGLQRTVEWYAHHFPEQHQ